MRGIENFNCFLQASGTKHQKCVIEPKSVCDVCTLPYTILVLFKYILAIFLFFFLHVCLIMSCDFVCLVYFGREFKF